MPADLIRFVDSITASPITRLDLNDEVSWWVKSFSAPPPRLRRSMASNAMRDGINVGSSTYDSRTLTIELECRKSTQDAAATEIQKLWRELDRPSNFIQYQPNSLTKPVFFRTYRSDASQLADVMAQQAMRSFTIELLAEPFALGLRETLGPYTVNNDPVAGTNPCSVQIGSSTILGDVPAPIALQDATAARSIGIVGMSTGFPFDARPTESGGFYALGTDTANPGGGPDAAMSGTSTNNFVRTSFATTATMATRLTASASNLSVSRRVFAVVRRSDATSVMSARLVVNGVAQDVVPIPLTTARQVIDLGRLDAQQAGGMARHNTTLVTTLVDYTVQASRTSGAGTLDWDVVYLVAADGTLGLWDMGAADNTSDDLFVISDGDETITRRTSGSSAEGGDVKQAIPFAGALPYVTPNATNYLTWIVSNNLAGGHVKTVTSALTIWYHPRYLFVRPVST